MKILNEVSHKDCIYRPVIYRVGSVSCNVVILLLKSGLTV